jgi:hAT family C-terminal dimerisation region
MQEEAINAVCASQQIDLSVRNIKLTDSDWVILHHLLKLFEIFIHPSRKLQASTYPTLNYAILQYLQIIKKLKEFQQTVGQDTAIALAAQRSIDKLNEYYNVLHTHAHAGIATICNPRFNFSVFQVVLPSSSDDRKRAKLRMNMKECYSRYQQREQAIRQAKQHENPLPTTQNEEDDDELSDAELYRSALAVPETETELQRYLGQERLPRDVNIYQYWKAKQYDFPIIARIAKDYLPIPATSALSEVVFSQGGDIVTKKRNRLTGESIRMIVCLKEWGVITDEDVDEESDNEVGDM